MNPYRVLSVQPGADEATIRNAFRNYVAVHHPDRGGDALAFQRGVEAFRRLSEQPAPVSGTLGTHYRQNVVGRFVNRWKPKGRGRRRVI
jgi:hypothetical protein